MPTVGRYISHFAVVFLLSAQPRLQIAPRGPVLREHRFPNGHIKVDRLVLSLRPERIAHPS